MNEAPTTSADKQADAVRDAWAKVEMPSPRDLYIAGPSKALELAETRKDALMLRMRILGEILPDVRTDICRSLMLEETAGEYHRGFINSREDRKQEFLEREKNFRDENNKLRSAYFSGKNRPFLGIFIAGMQNAIELYKSGYLI